MAKGDFDLDEEEFDVVYDEKKKNSFFSRMKKSSNDQSNSSNELNNNQDYNSDLGDFSSVNQINNADVVFEEKTNMTTAEKIKDLFSTVNIRMLVIVVGVFLIIFVVAFMIILSVIKSNKAYSSDIMIPDVVYMGETSSIYVSTNYTGGSKPKKDINKTETVFSVSDPKTLYILQKSMKGSSINNTIIPVQEGSATVEVNSKLDGRKIGNLKKKVIVCPDFNNSLVLLKNISITKGSSHNLNIDFGEEECAKGVTYSSSNEKIATVDENGRVTGLELGKSILTIRRGSKTISLTINVTDDFVSLKTFKVIPDNLQLTKGEKYRLKIDYSPINATSFNISFYSDNEDVVKVSNGGLVEAVGVGNATIKVVNSSYTLSYEVSITVKDNNSDSFATDMILDKSELKLVQGNTDKIQVTLTPKNVSNNVLSWKSADDNIASVTSDGVIYAKNVGSTVITASTDNGISREVKVTVIKMKTPIIKSTDAIESDYWHTRPFVLSFSGADNGAIYYYGNSIDKMNTVAEKITISKDENKTYYVKACTRTCSETCVDKKDKKGRVVKDSNGEAIKICSSRCSDKPSVCSDPVSYVSKYDGTKPYVNGVAPSSSGTVQISIVDNTSFVQKWCVTNRNSYASCRWKTIQTNSNPVIMYKAPTNGIYYVFAKDVAGNMSNSYKFEITNIE